MSGVLELLRQDLRNFTGYRSARSEAQAGSIWLNANESPWPSTADIDGSLRRYPDPQPPELINALATLYGCAPAQLLVGRGSDEAIDLLVRAFCAPGSDGVLVTPPVFGMYAICARLHGVRLVEVPLHDGESDFRADLDAIACRAREENTKLVFLCSPGNPAGGRIPADDVLRLARELWGTALVIIDEAYIEFADGPSLVPLVHAQANLAVLRTLSKAHALAAVRVGCVVADATVIGALRCCQAPYPIPAPCVRYALDGLRPVALEATRRTIAHIRRERQRLMAPLRCTRGVRRVYPSEANFLLLRFTNAAAAYGNLLAAGIVVRDMRSLPQLADALRISIGSPSQNNHMLQTLANDMVKA